MDKITDTFINLNITKNGKTTTEIYLNDNELLQLMMELQYLNNIQIRKTASN